MITRIYKTSEARRRAGKKYFQTEKGRATRLRSNEQRRKKTALNGGRKQTPAWAALKTTPSC